MSQLSCGNEPAQGRDGQRNNEQPQGGKAGSESDGGCGVRAQIVGDGAPDEAGRGPEAGEPGEGFEHDECRAFHMVDQGRVPGNCAMLDLSPLTYSVLEVLLQVHPVIQATRPARRSR